MVKKLLLLLMLIAIGAAGYYWQNRKLPANIELPQMLKPNSEQPKLLYKWRDENGKIHYSDQAPEQKSAIIIEAPSADTNVIRLNQEPAQ